MTRRFGVALVLVLVVAACSQGKDETAPPTTTSRPTPERTIERTVERTVVRGAPVRLTPTRMLILPGPVRASAAHGTSIALLVEDAPGHECDPVVHWDASSGRLRRLPTGIRPDGAECRLLPGPVGPLALALDERQVGVFIEYPIPHSADTTENTLVTVPLDGAKRRLVREIVYTGDGGGEQIGRLATDNGTLVYEVRVAYGPTEHIEFVRFGGSAPQEIPGVAGNLVGLQGDRLLVRDGRRLRLLRTGGQAIWKRDADAQQTLFDAENVVTLERGSIAVHSAADGAERARYRVAGGSMRPWLVGVTDELVAYATRRELHLLDVGDGRDVAVRLAGCKPSGQDGWLSLASGGLFCGRRDATRIDFVPLSALRAALRGTTGGVTEVDRLPATPKPKLQTQSGDVVVELEDWALNHQLTLATLTLRDVPGGVRVAVQATEPGLDLAERGPLSLLAIDCQTASNTAAGGDGLGGDTLHRFEPTGRTWATTIPFERLDELEVLSAGFLEGGGFVCGDL